MFSKIYLLKAALVAAVLIISNPMISNAQKNPPKPCTPSSPKPCQSVPVPAMLPAFLLLGGGMMLYKRRKQSS